MVPLTHANLCASARNVAASLALEPSDRCLNVMPLFHIHGLVAAVLASLEAGASVACTPGFHAPQFFGWLDELSPTWYTAVPTMHQAVLERARPNEEILARRPLRLIRSSSASLPPTVMRDLERAFGAPVIEAYGMTEAAHQMSSNPLPPRERKPGSVGLAAGPDIAVLDDAGRRLPPRVEGEIAIRGDNVFRGYEENEEANAAAFTEGWFRTGDQGYLDEAGYLFLTGRLKEIINRGGEKISPREIDEVLLDHPAVAQAVAFAVPDRSLGEEVAAAVVLREGASAEEGELQDFTAARLADFKVPRRVIFVEEIPKGPTGKLQRIGLAAKLGVSGGREPLAGGPSVYAAPETSAEKTLAAVASDVLAVGRVGATDDLFDLGLDSLLATQLLARASDAGIGDADVPITVLLRAPTVRLLAALLESGERPVESCIVPIQPDGPMPPLYFVHPHDGRVVHFRPLAESLGLDQPLYALQAPPDGERRYERVEHLARRYVEEIRLLQPEGPYHLGGHCMGGAVAFEMAQQLRADGATVGVLALVNPSGEPRSSLAFRLRRSRQVARRAVQHARKGRLNMAVRWWLRRELSGVAAAEPELRVESSLMRARNSYSAAPYPGRILLFRDRDYLTPTSFWERIALGGLEFHSVPGDQGTVLRPPNVAVIARYLSAALEREAPARANCTSG
jgi:thioesterase domain-containing protein